MGVDDLINAGSLVNLPITDFALTSVPAGFTESLSLHGNSLDPNVAAVPGPPIGGQLAAGSGLLWLVSLGRWRKQRGSLAIDRSRGHARHGLPFRTTRRGKVVAKRIS